MDSPTPDTIFTALFIGSMIIAIYILTRIHIKQAYERAHPRIYTEFDYSRKASS